MMRTKELKYFLTITAILLTFNLSAASQTCKMGNAPEKLNYRINYIDINSSNVTFFNTCCDLNTFELFSSKDFLIVKEDPKCSSLCAKSLTSLSNFAYDSHTLNLDFLNIRRSLNRLPKADIPVLTSSFLI